jgi:hypothetical protein
VAATDAAQSFLALAEAYPLAAQATAPSALRVPKPVQPDCVQSVSKSKASSFILAEEEQVMRVTGGQIVLTRGQELPYKVVLQYEWGDQTEHPTATVRQGEAMIRSRLMPPPPDQVNELRHSPRLTTPLSLVPSQHAVPEVMLSVADLSDEPFVDDGADVA